MNFGFEANGTFDLTFTSDTVGSLRGFLLPEQDASRIIRDPRGFSITCLSPDHHVSDINISQVFSGGSLHWAGFVPEENVFALYFWNCNRTRADFRLRAQFTNPSSRLDTRDMILPRLYTFFSFVYAIFSLVWAINALCFLNFRVPLHTIFLLLPIIRGISLWISKSYWSEAQFTDAPSQWKIFAITALEFLFYTMTLVGISFACAGFCIYRQKFVWRDRIEIVFSAAVVVGSILSAQLVSDIKQAFFLLGLICFTILWYLKQGLINIVMLTGVMKQLKSEPQVIAKVSLSRNFVVSSFLTVFLTLLISSIVAGLDTPKRLSAMILESGMMINSVIHFHFFLLRKKYAGNDKKGTRKAVKRPFVMMEPGKSVLVILSQ
jgi:hypothetical protein